MFRDRHVFTQRRLPPSIPIRMKARFIVPTSVPSRVNTAERQRSVGEYGDEGGDPAKQDGGADEGGAQRGARERRVAIRMPERRVTGAVACRR